MKRRKESFYTNFLVWQKISCSVTIIVYNFGDVVIYALLHINFPRSKWNFIMNTYADFVNTENSAFIS